MKNLIFPFIAILFLISGCKQEKYDLIVQDVNIIDVKTGNVKSHQDIGIRNQKIISIENGNSLTGQEITKIINATDKYVIPGLWDMHVHLYFPYKEYLKMYMAHGIVGVREMSGMHLEWKDSTNQNCNIPHMMISSEILEGPVVWFKSHKEVKGTKEAIKLVREAKEKGQDFVKLLSFVSKEQYLAIAKECKKLNFEFSGHVPVLIDVLEAAKIGQKTNEHLQNVLLACSSKEDSLRNQLHNIINDIYTSKKLVKRNKIRFSFIPVDAAESFDEQKAIEFIKKLSKYDMYQCPTLGTSRSGCFNEIDLAYNDDRSDYFPFPKEPKPAFKSGVPKHILKFRHKNEIQCRVTKIMQSLGIPLLAGTDNAYAGFNLHDELEYFVMAGLSEAEALQTATINPAKYMDQEDQMGSIEVNKSADLVLLNSNPLENIRNTRDIHKVIFKNQILNPDSLLQDVKIFNKDLMRKIAAQKERSK